MDLLSAGGELTKLSPPSQLGAPWEGQFTVPLSLSPGARVIPLRLTDGEGETILASNSGSLPLLEIENENPSLQSVEVLSSGNLQTTISDEGEVRHVVSSPTNDVVIPHTLEVSVNDPDGVSSVQAKIGRLADIGKSDEWLLLVDDGTSGDRIAGDGVFSLEFNVRPSVPEGDIDVLIRASDIFFATTSNLVAKFDTNLLNNIPRITGTVTIKNILIGKSPSLTPATAIPDRVCVCITT